MSGLHPGRNQYTGWCSIISVASSTIGVLPERAQKTAGGRDAELEAQGGKKGAYHVFELASSFSNLDHTNLDLP